jgi:hypothetical protein
MAAVSLGTTTLTTSLIGQPQSHQIFKTSDGVFIMIAFLSTNYFAYKKSTDGVTWSGTWTNIVATTNGNFFMFDAYMDASNNILFSYAVFSGAWIVNYLKMTYSSGSWSIGSGYTIKTNLFGVNDSLTGLSITKDSSGNVWVAIYKTVRATIHCVYSSNDTGAGSWTAKDISAAANINSVCLIPVGSNIWCVVQYSTGVYYFIYTSSWGTVQTAVASGVTAGVIGVLKIADANIIVAYRTSSGIQTYKFTTSWAAFGTVSAHAADDICCIQQVNGYPCVVWQDYNGAAYEIAYRYYDIGGWGSITALTATTYNYKPSVAISDSGNLYVVWYYGSGSPYTIYFQDLSLYVPPIEVILDIENKVGFVTRMLYNATNKVSFVFRQLKDFKNYFNSVARTLYNINNDFRSIGRGLYDIDNDVRFLDSYQVPGNAGAQSLGKKFIHLYFASTEQTDFVVDSVKIHKEPNQSHSLSFELARAYDVNIPVAETVVTIYYNTTLLYKGKIVKVSPAESPEKISVLCNDKYWSDNRTIKYFKVGHEPMDDPADEVWYNTIKQAILTEFGWSIEPGDFVPESISCFGLNYSDALSNLISACGNFKWYYDENDNKKLWSAGQGSIVKLDRQVIGQNLSIYHILDHTFNKDTSNIINKYRVQIGTPTYAGGRKYSGYNYRNYSGTATPAWNTDINLFASNGVDGEGWDSHAPEHDGLYVDVFKKYNLPHLDSTLEEWTDAYTPVVTIYAPDNSWETMNCFDTELATLVETLHDGFTIDYKAGTITFNEPKFLYLSDANDEIVALRSPIIKVEMWKKQYYSYTDDSLINPLVFETSQMGSYPISIEKFITLSQFTVQYGYASKVYQGVYYQIPPWDDRPYAIDEANFMLSNSCDEKIYGTITLTLDAVCLYGIDLTKRIYIEGITSEPMNILSMSYDLGNFTVQIDLENSRYYKRTISLPWHGQ